MVGRSGQQCVEELYPVTGSPLEAGQTNPGKHQLTSLVAIYDGVNDGLIDSGCHDDSHCGSHSSLLAHRWKPMGESVNQCPPLSEKSVYREKYWSGTPEMSVAAQEAGFKWVSPISNKYFIFFTPLSRPGSLNTSHDDVAIPAEYVL